MILQLTEQQARVLEHAVGWARLNLDMYEVAALWAKWNDVPVGDPDNVDTIEEAAMAGELGRIQEQLRVLLEQVKSQAS